MYKINYANKSKYTYQIIFRREVKLYYLGKQVHDI